jgi:hypothetical protein
MITVGRDQLIAAVVAKQVRALEMVIAPSALMLACVSHNMATVERDQVIAVVAAKQVRALEMVHILVIKNSLQVHPWQKYHQQYNVYMLHLQEIHNVNGTIALQEQVCVYDV